jgi:hypothetical protein
MSQVKDFEMDRVLRVLDAVSKNYSEGSQEEGSIQLAAISLLYVRQLKKMDDFLKYYREFFDPAFKVSVARVFSTRQEADEWLAQGLASDGDLVKIAGQGFQVIQLPKGLSFLRTPLPEELGPPRSE